MGGRIYQKVLSTVQTPFRIYFGVRIYKIKFKEEQAEEEEEEGDGLCVADISDRLKPHQ